MSEIKHINFETSELARELKYLYPHLKDQIDKLSSMHMGETLRSKLMELKREMLQYPLAALAVGQELATELSVENYHAQTDS